jgi:hypothetical protein
MNEEMAKIERRIKLTGKICEGKTAKIGVTIDQQMIDLLVFVLSFFFLFLWFMCF